MAIVCPTITAESGAEFNQQLAHLVPFASRIHFDFADGDFAPRKLMSLGQAHFPEGIIADMHLMFTEPYAQLMTLISLQPHLVIVHVEAEGDLEAMAKELQKVHIKFGIALLPDTEVKKAAHLIALADHVLIFAGHLGFQGGVADMSQLYKVEQIRAIKPNVEISWDGGINDQNAKALADGGIDILNVGGFIQNAPNPQAAFTLLEKELLR